MVALSGCWSIREWDEEAWALSHPEADAGEVATQDGGAESSVDGGGGVDSGTVAADAGKYTLGERRRLSVKQGMTGLWQVSGRHSLSYEEWLRLDLGYIDSWSLYQDFIILLKTFREVVQGKNAG